MEKQMVALQGQVSLLKQKLENEKNKTIKPVPNKETGEVSLTFGIANKLLRDKAKKEEEKKPVEDVAEANDGDKRDGDPCWKGYKQVGMKDKNGKEVPNCVPMTKEELQEAGIDPKDVKQMEKPLVKEKYKGAKKLVDGLIKKKLKGEK